MASDFNPFWWFDAILKGIDNHPNVAFWSIVTLSVVLTTSIPNSTSPDAIAWQTIPVATWCNAGLILTAVMGGIVAVALLTCLLTPAGIGRPLAVSLIARRSMRFVFGVAASLFSLWTIASAVGLAFRIHGWLTITTHTDLTPIGGAYHETSRPPPWEFKIALIAGVAIVLAIVLVILLPVLKDVARIVVGAVRVNSYSRWAREHAHEVTAPRVSVAANDSPVQVLLISDLHCTAPDAKTIEGTREDAAMQKFVVDSIRRLSPQLIIGAGDMTDTGDSRAWAKLRSFLPADRRLVIAPGNHDVNFANIGPARRRWIAFLETLDIDPETDRSTSYSETNVSAEITATSNTSGLTVIQGTTSYPIVYDDPDLGVTILILNSNRRPSTSPLTNAFGFVGDHQLVAARELLDRRTAAQHAHLLLIVVHHHMFPPDDYGIQERFLVCTDAGQVLELAVECRAAAVIHGHEHMPFVNDFKRKGHQLLVISLGSALYPADGPCKAEVINPSVAALTLVNNTIQRVEFHRDVNVPS